MIDTAQACLNEEAVGNAWKKNTFCPKLLLYENDPLPYSLIDFPAIFSRRKMDDFLKLLEEESQRIVAGTESHFADGQI